ncbi:MAG: VIT family protein [Candidatus Dormibacteraeota bacterium]|nr:VIT family protein [Candidatus Dormibacteraeota bacterium]
MPTGEHHSGGTGWLRAAVLGADDGIVSTASLMLGVATANADAHQVLAAGIAGLVAGAMSMAAGEYVSVSTQRDAEQADLQRERVELREDPKGELEELAQIYVTRGVEPDLARRVAAQLMQRDPLGAHARDELGITDQGRARPVQAGLSSAGAFASGAILPILGALLVPVGARAATLAAVALVALAILGSLGAMAGGANWRRGALRVLVGGAAAMVVTAGIGHLVGAANL